MLTICRLLVFLAISLLDSRIHASLYSITLMGFYSTDGDEMAFFVITVKIRKYLQKPPKYSNYLWTGEQRMLHFFPAVAGELSVEFATVGWLNFSPR